VLDIVLSSGRQDPVGDAGWWLARNSNLVGLVSLALEARMHYASTQANLE